jgi:hypothetical protein
MDSYEQCCGSAFVIFRSGSSKILNADPDADKGPDPTTTNIHRCLFINSSGQSL